MVKEILEFLLNETKKMEKSGKITSSQHDAFDAKICTILGDANTNGLLKDKLETEYLKNDILIMLDAEIAAF